MAREFERRPRRHPRVLECPSILSSLTKALGMPSGFASWYLSRKVSPNFIRANQSSSCSRPCALVHHQMRGVRQGRCALRLPARVCQYPWHLRGVVHVVGCEPFHIVFIQLVFLVWRNAEDVAADSSLLRVKRSVDEFAEEEWSSWEVVSEHLAMYEDCTAALQSALE